MNDNEFFEHLNSDRTVIGGSEIHLYMSALSQQAMKITCELNNKYNTPEQIIELMSELTGRPIDRTFRMFPPFYTDCGRNIIIGKNIFINSGCRFQDQGGITIGDGTLIGHNAVLATLNHGFEPERRGDLHPAAINIGKNVWLGANVTVLPGVSIGDNSVIAAGAVVNRDVPSNTVYGGVPAKLIKSI